MATNSDRAERGYGISLERFCPSICIHPRRPQSASEFARCGNTNPKPRLVRAYFITVTALAADTFAWQNFAYNRLGGLLCHDYTRNNSSLSDRSSRASRISRSIWGKDPAQQRNERNAYFARTRLREEAGAGGKESVKGGTDCENIALVFHRKNAIGHNAESIYLRGPLLPRLCRYFRRGSRARCIVITVNISAGVHGSRKIMSPPW